MVREAKHPEIGKRIAAIAAAKGITYERLASSVGASSVKMITSGKSDGSVDALIRIAKSLGVTLDRIVYGDESPRLPEHESDALAVLQWVVKEKVTAEELARVISFGHLMPGGQRPDFESFKQALDIFRRQKGKQT